MAEEQQLADLLGGPVETIKIGPMEIRLYPAGLPESRDLQHKFTEMNLRPGDALPEQEEPDEDALAQAVYQSVDRNFEFYSYIFWLVIRQGTPGMDVQRVLREEWEYDAMAALRFLGIYIREHKQAFYDVAVQELAKLTGLFTAKEDEEGEVERAEDQPTQKSPPPANEPDDGNGQKAVGQ